MNVFSLFSGIGGLDKGLHDAGLSHVGFCESDEWRRRVLTARWPGVSIYDDVRVVGLEPEPRRAHLSATRTCSDSGRSDAIRGIDLLCGGFPCQDLSVAGQRRGLAGERSGLFHEFARIIDAVRPGWVLIENVPGLLSSNGGRDFGIVLGTLADLGYGLAWRILDSRFFGVPQRRRRVFIVGTRANGDPRAAADCAGQVLAVGSRCDRHPAAGGEARQDVAVASLSGLGSGGPDDNDGQAGRVIVANTMTSQRGNEGGGISPEETLVPLAFHMTQDPISGLEVPAIGRKSGGNGVTDGMGVRRLTPRECERLQGLPDDWTLLDERTPDSRRYSALGDAVTATVGEWIGRRLLEAAS